MVKDLYKEAHILTKKICADYDDIYYKTQFQLCLSYLSDENVNKRIEEIMTEVKVSQEEARLLDQIEYSYKTSFNTDINLSFRLWQRQEKRRVYITSEYIKDKTYVDLNSKRLYNKNLTGIF